MRRRRTQLGCRIVPALLRCRSAGRGRVRARSIAPVGAQIRCAASGSSRSRGVSCTRRSPWAPGHRRLQRGGRGLANVAGGVGVACKRRRWRAGAGALMHWHCARAIAIEIDARHASHLLDRRGYCSPFWSRIGSSSWARVSSRVCTPTCVRWSWRSGYARDQKSSYAATMRRPGSRRSHCWRACPRGTVASGCIAGAAGQLEELAHCAAGARNRSPDRSGHRSGGLRAWVSACHRGVARPDDGERRRPVRGDEAQEPQELTDAAALGATPSGDPLAGIEVLIGADADGNPTPSVASAPERPAYGVFTTDFDQVVRADCALQGAWSSCAESWTSARAGSLPASRAGPTGCNAGSWRCNCARGNLISMRGCWTQLG